MQNPFDMYSIQVRGNMSVISWYWSSAAAEGQDVDPPPAFPTQDIIFSTRPTLLIETGKYPDLHMRLRDPAPQ